jgi:predicted permease
MDDPTRPAESRLRRYLRFWGANVREDVDTELQFHLDARTDELVASGHAPDLAREQAIREFGDVGRVRRVVRAMDEHHARRLRFREWLMDASSDVRYAVRSLRKSPALVLVIVCTLTLGIGLNGTIFSIVNAYLLRPLPLPRAERLVVMGSVDPAIGMPVEMSYLDYRDYRALADVFADLAATASVTASLTEGDRSERVWLEQTTGNYFATLRPPLLLGRGYSEEESARAARVVVLSFEYWQRRFRGDSSIVGRPIRIDGTDFTVLGVAGRGFRGFAPMISSDGWTPIDESPAGQRGRLASRGSNWLNVVGVLAPGVSLKTARAAVSARAAQLRRDYPETNRNLDAVVVPETRARPVLAIAQPVPLIAIVLMSLTMLVLVIACANIANLLLARGTVREHEHAIRAALGASRWRLVRQSLVEVALLSIAGGAGALALAHWAARWMSGLRVATDAPVFFEFTTDRRVFVFTLIVALATTMLAGLLPALRSGRVSPQGALGGGKRAGGDRKQHRLRSTLVVMQIAVSVLVLVCSGLFVRSMRAAQTMDLGFRTRGLLLAAFDVSLARYDSARTVEFERHLVDRVRQLPGVDGAALVANIPFGYSNSTARVVTDRTADALPETGLPIFYTVANPDHFSVGGPTLVRGRAFTVTDDATKPNVAVVNEAMARRLWPGTDAIGQRFRTPENKREYEVIGIAQDSKFMFLGESPRPFFWRALGQAPRQEMFLEIASRGDMIAVERAVRGIVRDFDPDLPLFDVRTMDEHLRNGRALFAVRIGAMFGGAFAFLALTLAAVGVYGVVSYSVNNRTREIGIRIALGAVAASVVRLVVRQGMTLAAIGVVIGVVMAFLTTRLMATLLYGVQPSDPVAFGIAVGVLVAVSVGASWVPARRAARLDPVRALRAE